MHLSRRHFVFGAAAISVAACGPSLKARWQVPGPTIVVWLSGGADTLTLFPLIGSPDYSRLRPRIAIPKDSALPLDGKLALHPRLAKLHRFWPAGRLGVVLNVGHPVRPTPGGEAQSLLGTSLEALQGRSGVLGRLLRRLAPELSTRVLLDTSGAILATRELEPVQSQPRRAEVSDLGNRHEYPSTPLGKQLRAIAHAIRTRPDVRLGVARSSGWNILAGQGGLTGALSRPLEDVAASISALEQDLSQVNTPHRIFIVSELGRSARENAFLAANPGHASFVLTLGPRGSSGIGAVTDLEAFSATRLLEDGAIRASWTYDDVFDALLDGRKLST
jgi:uncharacterized protein (DUF1501 family)